MTDTLSLAPKASPRTHPVADRGGPRQPMLIVEDLKKHFPIKSGGAFGGVRSTVKAVDGVNFTVAKRETLGVVGESGCGKSTMARLLSHLIVPDEGSIIFDGDKVGSSGGISVRDLRRQMQMVFQDSYSSLNPRLPIVDSIAFGPKASGVKKSVARARAEEILGLVGLNPRQFARRYPHQLSGGQRQRVNIARALAMEPRLVVLDEAVSALDKSVEAQVLNLLARLKEQFELTYIFISHDLNVVQYISDRVLVMYLGQVVEIGDVDELYERPSHPYTQALLSSRPSMDPARRRTEPPLSGDPPNPVNLPSGCRFRTRCALAEDVCARVAPKLTPLPGSASHPVACHARIPGGGHSLSPAA
ncbi:ABC transporter ATP-binding protein [Acuticoccus sediminis]|uniref:ABC transporter ATP-binding protein n=1 Tax=Acuticoccus sediminis TaxID=2184697 RepID=UPI001CFE2A65|nr:ABC transporter ATP-binding protein [Acuticoccus sediminis]